MPRRDLPAARVSFGAGIAQSVGVYAHVRGGELGTPTVEIGGDIELARLMMPDTADRLADALKLAARIARGEPIPPTALDEFMARRDTTPTGDLSLCRCQSNQVAHNGDCIACGAAQGETCRHPPETRCA